MALYHGSPSFAKWWYSTPVWVETLLLAVWPSSILLVADPMDNNVVLWAVSAAVNSAVYALVGSVLLHVLLRRR
jgi:hypothetical protein